MAASLAVPAFADAMQDIPDKKADIDGDTLSGRWEYNPATFSSGMRGSGTWTFKRIR